MVRLFIFKYRYKYRLGTSTVLKVSIWHRYRTKPNQYPSLAKETLMHMLKYSESSDAGHKLKVKIDINTQSQKVHFSTNHMNMNERCDARQGEGETKTCVLCWRVKQQQNYKEYSLLGTVYELVLIRPFIARLHAFILPKAFGVLIELLEWGWWRGEGQAREKEKQSGVTVLVCASCQTKGKKKKKENHTFIFKMSHIKSTMCVAKLIHPKRKENTENIMICKKKKVLIWFKKRGQVWLVK